jgi:hypothetical protein
MRMSNAVLKEAALEKRGEEREETRPTRSIWPVTGSVW